MYAIVEILGHQYKVEKGDEILVDLMSKEAKEKVTFDHVIMLKDKKANIGTPYVNGATIEAEVVSPLVKGAKLIVFHFKNKTNQHKKTGHRQKYTLIKILDIKNAKAVKKEEVEAV